MAKTKKEQRPLDEMIADVREMTARKSSLCNEIDEISVSINEMNREIANQTFLRKTIRQKSGYFKVREIEYVSFRNDPKSPFCVHVKGESLQRYGHMGVVCHMFLDNIHSAFAVDSDFRLTDPGEEFTDDKTFDRIRKEAKSTEEFLNDCIGDRISKNNIILFAGNDGNLVRGSVISFDFETKCFKIAYPFIQRSGIDNQPLCGEERICLPGNKLYVVD